MTGASSKEIEDQALRWVWRLDREGYTPALKATLEEWLASDTRHRGAFLQAEAAWALLDTGQRRLSERDAGVVAAPRRPENEALYAPRVLSRRHMLLGGALVSVGVACLGIFLPLTRAQRYGTGIGEVRMEPLADGSSAMLNTQSSIAVDMTDSSRTVKVIEGEVWFHVAKDRKRPFVVSLGDIRVRAVGTAFSVKRRESGAEVLVTEGTVETWIDGKREHSLQATAGTRVSILNDAALSTDVTAATDIERALAWREGKIELTGQTLAEAASDFNRYNARKLIVVDERLSHERVYGVFRTSDPVGFAHAIHESLGAQVSGERSAVIQIAAP
jgi:transmembrane sensor